MLNYLRISNEFIIYKKRKLFSCKIKKNTRIVFGFPTVRVFDLFNYKVALIQQLVNKITFTSSLTGLNLKNIRNIPKKFITFLIFSSFVKLDKRTNHSNRIWNTMYKDMMTTKYTCSLVVNVFFKPPKHLILRILKWTCSLCCITI